MTVIKPEVAGGCKIFFGNGKRIILEKLILETCNLEMTLESDGNWRVPPTKCKTDKSEIEVFGTVSIKDKKILLQMSGEFPSLKYTWRFEDTEK